ncbi:hypothetical protein ACE5IS_10675 [Leptospira wolffii]|uniref:Uncharacterized protein n=1 Tax=Leptospira wolffii TaxID=409998 RepID=A0ABV5BTQ2_9LEPT
MVLLIYGVPCLLIYYYEQRGKYIEESTVKEAALPAIVLTLLGILVGFSFFIISIAFLLPSIVILSLLFFSPKLYENSSIRLYVNWSLASAGMAIVTVVCYITFMTVISK